MQICKNCGFENNDTAVFCANCGNFLQWTADDEGGARSQIASATPGATAEGVRPRGNRRRPEEGTPRDRPPLSPATEDVSTPAPVPPGPAPAPPSPSAETGTPASASSAETPGAAPDTPIEVPAPVAPSEAVASEPPSDPSVPPAEPVPVGADRPLDLTETGQPTAQAGGSPPSGGEPPDITPPAPPAAPDPGGPGAEPPPSEESTSRLTARPGAVRPRTPTAPTAPIPGAEDEAARAARARMLAAMPGERPGPQRTTVLQEEKPFAALTVSITPTELSVAPGETVSCDVVVRNTGTVVDQATFQVEGDAARWAAVEPPTVNVYPGESGTSTLRFFPPRSPSTPSGPARFALRALSHEDPAVTATARGVLNVAPYYDVSAELIPFTSQGRRRAEHRFTVSNQGNTRMRSAVNTSDPDNQLRFSVNPSTLAADPGTDAAATVQVRPRKPLWLGSPLLRPFEVTAPSEGAAPALRSQGQFQQIAWIPRWVPRVAMLIIPLLIALFVYLLLTANVPAVAGQPSDQATALLTKAGFKPLAAVSQPDDTVHIGDVVSTSPAGGRHRKHSPVNVVLSSGIPLPNLAGQDEAAGRAALEGKGLIVDEQQVSNAAPMGKIVGTAPPNGSVSKGDHVGLIISTGIPSLAASPNSVTMPGQAVNSTTAPLAVSIANGGTGPLTVSSVALGGPNASEFAVANNGCMGASVAPASSCSLQVTFTPTAAGARNAVLTFASNAPQSPPVTLSGTGLVSDIGVGATAINFGDQKVGTQSPAQTVAVSNKGSAPMKMAAATVIGPNAKEFILTDGCNGNTVAPGAGCSIGVVFAPAGTGARSAKLVAANDSGLSQNVTLSGNGTAPMVVTVPDPTVGLTFTEANKPQAVKIINQGTAPLVLGQITVVGVPQEMTRNFQAVPDCGGQLAPNGGSCNVSVTFMPSALTDNLKCAVAALVISDELGDQKIPMVWTSPVSGVVCNLTDILSKLEPSP